MDLGSSGLGFNYDWVLYIEFLDKTLVFHNAFLLQYIWVLANPSDNLPRPSNAE